MPCCQTKRNYGRPGGRPTPSIPAGRTPAESTTICSLSSTPWRGICGCTGLTKQTVNSVIRTLKGEGHVVLSPGREDRREKQVALTEQGAAYARDLLAPLHELERTVFTRMGSGRVEQMVNDITLFSTVFEKEMEKRLK